jgi:2-iminobutanoate/2-iminopropanoate deaminase
VSDRKSIHIAEFQHANPIPAASRVGNLLVSGVIIPRDGATGEVPPTLEEQAAKLFQHVRRIVEAGGGTTDDIVKINIWLKNPADRAALNDEWVKMFPDPESRPARHTNPLGGDGPTLITCDVMAVIGT